MNYTKHVEAGRSFSKKIIPVKLKPPADKKSIMLSNFQKIDEINKHPSVSFSHER